jgi:hypothetical protein
MQATMGSSQMGHNIYILKIDVSTKMKASLHQKLNYGVSIKVVMVMMMGNTLARRARGKTLLSASFFWHSHTRRPLASVRPGNLHIYIKKPITIEC